MEIMVTTTQAPRRAETQAIGMRGARPAVRHRVWRPAKQWTLEHGDRVFPLVAAFLITASIAFPYWRLQLNAPQYPGGLHATIYVDHVAGDVGEINGLNHYIGMRPLEEGGEVERGLALYVIPAMAALAALTAIRRRWIWLASIPAVLFPVMFTVDLYYWLREFGHNLDPTAALSSSIDEFTPTILGPGRVGQFTTTSFYDLGFAMALLGSLLLVLAIAVRITRERRRL
jgi:hypothetical protein